MKTKICTHCKQNKPISEFYKHCIMKDGLASWCKSCNKENGDRWRKKNPKRVLFYVRRHRRRLKDEVFSHYGGAICSWCGETNIVVLVIDHINGKGNEHRRSIGISEGGGARFYQWLKNNNFPSGYQVLCYNCNIRKYREEMEL